MTEPETGNKMWITAVTPTGVHLWEVGEMTVDEGDEVSAFMDNVRAQLGFPVDWMENGEPWGLSFSPGQPFQYFHQSADGLVPNHGVTLHDETPRPQA